MTTTVPTVQTPTIVVEEMPIDDIKYRFRLRRPKDSKIQELANSIKQVGLINPITVDANGYLIAGWHRWNSMKLLGYKTIPVIRKETSRVYSQLIEVEENISRADISCAITYGEHMVKREELLDELGIRFKNGRNQHNSEGLVTTTQLAEEYGMSNRVYRMKRQPASIDKEARDLLRDTKFAENLVDMVTLSKQEPQVQKAMALLLTTGKCLTFKRALVEANTHAYNSTREFLVNFDMKERWGIPKTCMTFKKAHVELQKVCDLIAKDHECELIKRKKLHFGASKVPLYAMAADHAEFLITYYTPENGLILDQFMGRGTNGIAALFHNRRFIGYDVQENNVRRFKEVVNEYLPFAKDKYEVHHSDGIALEELADKSNYLDGAVCDPPYVLNAERYSNDPRDISSLNHAGFMGKIKENFDQMYRLIKKSDFEKKIFYPVIYKVGMGRKGAHGIIDMDADFQYIAKQAGFVLWDKLFNQLATPWSSVNWERNYVNKYVMKNFETNLVFCKF